MFGGKIIKAININQHQSTSINIQQNSSDFALSCPMLHVVDPWPTGVTGAPTLPTLDPPSSVADGFQSQQPVRSRESFGQKSQTRKIRPEARGFAFARAGGCDDLNHLRFAPV